MQYQTLRSVSDNHVFVVCRDGTFYESVPADVRKQGPWQGQHRGEMANLNHPALGFLQNRKVADIQLQQAGRTFGGPRENTNPSTEEETQCPKFSARRLLRAFCVSSQLRHSPQMRRRRRLSVKS
jgi:hypothetical protein